MTDTVPFSEDDKLDYVRGTAAAEVATALAEAERQDLGVAAELALMRGLRHALAEESVAPNEFGWQRLKAEITREARPRTTSQIWRIAALVCGVAVLGQGAYIAVSPDAAPSYQTATAPDAAPSVQVGFAATATMAEVAELLRRTEATLSGGPTALGLYRLGFATPEAREAALPLLEASPFVTLVAKE